MIQVDKKLFEAKAANLLQEHPFLKLLHSDSVQVILHNCAILKVRTGQMLYKQTDPTYERMYIMLVGKIAICTLLGQSSSADTVGYARAGDSLGEEGVFESSGNPRKDSAIAEEDSYVFEIIKSNFD